MRGDDHDEIVCRYGPWRDRGPADVADLLADYPGAWWISGGWAIEAFSGVARPHGDIDPSIPVADVPLLRRHLPGRLEIWAADRGSLRPLTGDPDEPLAPTCGNLWLRAGGAQPWEYYVILMTADAATWTYKRDPRVSLPTADILWRTGGLTYLRPEVQLLHKAPGLRPKDQQDLTSLCRCSRSRPGTGCVARSTSPIPGIPGGHGCERPDYRVRERPSSTRNAHDRASRG